MNERLKVLRSTVDDTRNEIHDTGAEFRLVSRDDHDTVYLSSHTGCNLACQMCWLTATKQTKMRALTPEEIIRGARPMLELSTQRRTERYGRASRVNFSFMARGDALANPHIDWRLIRQLLTLAQDCGIPHAKVAISTIFPEALFDKGRELDGDLIRRALFRRFGAFQPTYYWSLYRADYDGIRDEWLPNALNPYGVCHQLREVQKATGQDIIIHHALIKGFNDDAKACIDIIDLVKKAELNVRVNLVRYNPPEGHDSEEADTDTYRLHMRLYQDAFGKKAVKVQPRVGPDVYASCGQFFNALETPPDTW